MFVLINKKICKIEIDGNDFYFNNECFNLRWLKQDLRYAVAGDTRVASDLNKRVLDFLNSVGALKYEIDDDSIYLTTEINTKLFLQICMV